MTALTDYSADLDETAALLHAVADPVRLHVLRRLADRPACVCTLLEQLPVAVNLLSYHLKVLRDNGLVTCTRRGRWIDYALAADALTRLHAALPSPANPPPRQPTSPEEPAEPPDQTHGDGANAGVSREALPK